MSMLQAIWAVVAAFLPFFVPGIFFIKIRNNAKVFSQGARILLWSLGVNTILLMLGLLLGVSVLYSFAGIAIIGLLASFVFRKETYSYMNMARVLAVVLGVVLLSSFFIVPFLFIQDGLPTGDVQKTIIWAQDSIATNHLPDYGKSFTLLNRDPVDFYTPGLHSVSAFVMQVSASPLLTISIFSIVSAIAVAWIAGALTQELFPKKKYALLPLLSILLLLTQFRFLRYLREPGYHFQNSFGEFFLFGMILLALSFLVRRKWVDVVLFFVCAIALFFTHQFSAFIGAFAFLFGAIALASIHSKDIKNGIRSHWHVSAGVIIGIVAAIFFAISFGLIKKIPSIFTLHPHLANLLPNITDYPSTMGTVWFFAGLFGLVLLVAQAAAKRQIHPIQIIFCVMTLAIFALSQGPNLGIDIPPIRALFYIAVPFSILGAYFFWSIAGSKKSLFVITALIVLITTISSTQKAFGSISHSVRTNSTLTGDQQYVITLLAEDKSNLGILIDDYNKRSASWFVLSGHPMFTRISSDLQTQMNEAGQSAIRNNLYINQLDYEKIFALGSLPEVGNLFAKHSIGYVTGVAGSSQFAFAHNPILETASIADNATIFKIKNSGAMCDSNSLCNFLLRPTTLANDIGDDEDTFEHLEASIRTPELSDPKAIKHITYRETSSPYIPLEFNVADYVQKIWPNDSKLQFVIRLTAPVSGLSLITTSGEKIRLDNAAQDIVTLTREQVQIDDRGFITLTIDNPMHKTIGIDLIALGL